MPRFAVGDRVVAIGDDARERLWGIGDVGVVELAYDDNSDQRVRFDRCTGERGVLYTDTRWWVSASDLTLEAGWAPPPPPKPIDMAATVKKLVQRRKEKAA